MALMSGDTDRRIIAGVCYSPMKKHFKMAYKSRSEEMVFSLAVLPIVSLDIDYTQRM